MRFIVDESTGAAVAEYLRSAGHDTVVVAEDMPQADDEDILARASREKRIVVTNDKDFGDLVFHSGKVHAGVLLLRLRDESPENRVRVVRAVLEQQAHRLSGRFAVATDSTLRVRPAYRPR